MAALQEDRAFWQLGSGGEVRVVLLIKYYRPNANQVVKARLQIWRASPGVPTRHDDVVCHISESLVKTKTY